MWEQLALDQFDLWQIVPRQDLQFDPWQVVPRQEYSLQLLTDFSIVCYSLLSWLYRGHQCGAIFGLCPASASSVL